MNREPERTLRCGETVLRVDAASGGRISALRACGHELLVPRGDDPLGWGCFPLAPWAGRLREGCFRFGARSYHFARNMPPHAIHGTVFRLAWSWVAEDTIATPLGPDWPFPGHAEQRFLPGERELRVRLEVHADEHPFPASAGFHPWFRRRLDEGSEARLAFEAAYRYADDAAGLPDGSLCAPGPGPWDACFTGLQRDPAIRWPGALRLSLSANHPQWVVYDRPAHALCVEPWTAPPNALNGAAHLVRPGDPLVLEMRLAWEPEGPGGAG